MRVKKRVQKPLEKVDDLTIRIKTKEPAPSLIEDIGRVFIISKSAAEWRSTTRVSSGPQDRFTRRPRSTAGRSSMALAHLMILV